MLDSMECGQLGGGGFPGGLGGGCFGVIEFSWVMALELIVFASLNLTCDYFSLFCFVSSVLLLDFLICQCIYRITGFCNILSSLFFF